MIEIRPFVAADLASLELQASQEGMAPWIGQGVPEALEHAGYAWTALSDGKPVVMAGIQTVDGRRYAWAFFGKAARSAMVAATRATVEVLNRETEPVVAHARVDVPADRRWLKLMGFQTTARIERLADGKDYELWVRL